MNMELNGKLNKWFNTTITEWVAKNFGESEAEDPSWSIEALSAHLANELVHKIDNKTKHYELTLLMNPALDVNEECDKIEAKLKEFGGKVIMKQNDGVKSMAYKVRDMSRAEFVYWDVEIPQDKVTPFTGYLNITDSILRWLFIVKDERRK